MADLAPQPPEFRFADPAIAQPEAPASGPAQFVGFSYPAAPHIDMRTHDEQPWRDPAEAAAPRQLKYWSAYRSGPALSVSGMDAETGVTRTVTGISSLGPDAAGAILVTDGQGQRWELVL